MVHHEIITASAGSGKTWKLIVRWIRLLALGAEPSSIIALTFSRKAAAEFFQGILYRIAMAASDPAEAAKLAEAIGLDADIHRFRVLLRQLVRNMHRLSLGTLDSFYVRIARSFPFELGLGGDFQLLDEHGVAIEQERVYRRVFGGGRRPTENEEQAKRDFLHAFQQATWGAEENRLRHNLNEFIRNWHDRYLGAGEPEKWGRAETIWPDGNGLPSQIPEITPLAESVRRQLPSLTKTHAKQPGMWQELADWLCAWIPGKIPEKSIAGRLEVLLENWSQFTSGGPVRLKFYYKEQELPAPFASALRETLAAILATEWRTALQRTQGIYRILSRYDGAYHEMVRRQGKLTFSDVQMVLAGDLLADGEGGIAGLTARDTESDRLFIDYRLDARYNHWLLDEFQDTSRLQWRILKNLADEVIQDTGGQRSFFAVGDTKQSIFVWRGGEPGLFREIAALYNRPGDPPRIALTPLNESRRSGPAVIDMVNAVFGDKDLLATVLPPESIAPWDFRPHISMNQDREGWAGLIEIPKIPETSAEERREMQFRAVADLLTRIDPLKRGLTCAVLTLRNRSAVELADYLRANSPLNVASESDTHFATDNPACPALLAMLRVAAHPGDDFSWQHILMTPLRAVLPVKIGIGEEYAGSSGTGAATADSSEPCRGTLVREVLERIASRGFEATLRYWISELKRIRTLDDFSLSRLDELCGSARDYDATGSRDIDAFLGWVQGQRLRESAGGGAVQIMTVHKSKGLTFDLVILPELHDQSQARVWSPVAVKRNAGRGIEWLTHVPRKMFAMTDPVLSRVVEYAEAEHWRERLSLLYVALTRARCANYVIVPQQAGKSEDSFNLVRVLRASLGDNGEGGTPLMLAGESCQVLWESGEPLWYEQHARRADPVLLPAPSQGDLFESAPDIGTIEHGGSAAKPRLVRLRPADPLTPGAKAGMLFKEGRLAARARGTSVHDALRQIGWAGPDTVRELSEWWRSRGLPDADFTAVHRCLTDPAVASLWKKPPGKVLLWRERPFDAVLDGQWFSGVFDRVVIEQNADGHPLSAEVIEFKTREDLPMDTDERHSAQAACYRRAVAALTGLPWNRVRVRLFYASGPASVLLEQTDA